MKQQIQFLLELHRFDTKVYEHREFLEKIPEELSTLEKEAGKGQSALLELAQKIGILEKEKGTKERDVEISETRLKEFQEKLSQIKTNKEYQAATKEVTETKKINKAREDQILELMNQIEILKKEKGELEGSVQISQAAYEKKKQEFEGESEKYRRQIQEFEEEGKKNASHIEPSVLNQYQRIRTLRTDAVTAVQGRTCQGCHMQIPPQLLIEIQKIKKLYHCPTCHRILYLPEWVQEGAA